MSKKNKFNTKPSQIGKFSNGGKSRFLPAWLERKPIFAPEPKKTVTTKTHKITFNFWPLIQWALVILAAYLLFSSCTITVVTN